MSYFRFESEKAVSSTSAVAHVNEANRRERERERERERDRQTDRQTDTDRETQRETETERQRQRDRDRGVEGGGEGGGGGGGEWLVSDRAILTIVDFVGRTSLTYIYIDIDR